MRGARLKEPRRTASAPAGTVKRFRRSRALWGLVGLAVVAAAVSAWAILGGGDGDSAPDPQPFGDPPEAPAAAAVGPPATVSAPGFRVVYQVEDTAGAQPLTSTDVLSVRLPFESRLEHRDGPAPGGDVLSATVTNRYFRFNFSGGEERFVTRQVPDPLFHSVSLETLEAAAGAGAAERLGPGNVAGEACTRYGHRTAGNEVLAVGDANQRVEVCVTPDAIVLSEVIVLDGRPVRRAEAVEVDRDPEFTAETFLTDRRPAEEGTRLVETSQAVSDGPAPEGVERIGVSVPEGFEPDRTVTVARQLGPNSPLTTMFVQSFRRGTEVVVVEELLTISETAPWPEAEGTTVDLGENRTGRVVYRTSSTEVRVRAGDEFVRVSASRPELALSVARTLTDNPTKPS